jgi:dipeptidyl aminopeptidase/acylaminoacyl peptidase
MTAWAVTQTERFKAALMGAGVADWRSFHGTSNIPTWDAIFYGTPGRPANPYDRAGPYAHFSALAHVASIRTPTLILHGERDECVPVGQGYQFFRALRERGVPVEMTVYPRAGHGLKERAHQRDMLTRSVEWFCRHLRPGE